MTRLIGTSFRHLRIRLFSCLLVAVLMLAAPQGRDASRAATGRAAGSAFACASTGNLPAFPIGPVVTISNPGCASPDTLASHVRLRLGDLVTINAKAGPHGLSAELYSPPDTSFDSTDTTCTTAAPGFGISLSEGDAISRQCAIGATGEYTLGVFTSTYDDPTGGLVQLRIRHLSGLIPGKCGFSGIAPVVPLGRTVWANTAEACPNVPTTTEFLQRWRVRVTRTGLYHLHIAGAAAPSSEVGTDQGDFFKVSLWRGGTSPADYTDFIGSAGICGGDLEGATTLACRLSRPGYYLLVAQQTATETLAISLRP